MSQVMGCIRVYGYREKIQTLNSSSCALTLDVLQREVVILVEQKTSNHRDLPKCAKRVSFCFVHSPQPIDHPGLSIGETAPALVPVSEVMMCMNCTSDFSLTLRRHHCHGCGRVSIPLLRKCDALARGMPPTVSAALLCCCRLFAGAAAGTDIR